jgi:hypothetical protein
MNDFEKESATMDMKEEMMSDAVDDAMEGEDEGEGEEMEGDKILKEVFDEIGMSMNESVSGLFPGRSWNHRVPPDSGYLTGGGSLIQVVAMLTSARLCSHCQFASQRTSNQHACRRSRRADFISCRSYRCWGKWWRSDERRRVGSAEEARCATKGLNGEITVQRAGTSQNLDWTVDSASNR